MQEKWQQAPLRQMLRMILDRLLLRLVGGATDFVYADLSPV